MSEPGALRELGRTLRQARERKALSIEQVSEKTRITPRHLHAIESGEFDRFPAPVYARGFVRAYAKAIDLDETAALAFLDEAGIAAATADPRGLSGSRTVAAPLRPGPASAPAAVPAVRVGRGRRIVFMVMGAVGAGIGAGAIVLLVGRLGDVRATTAAPPSPFATPAPAPVPETAKPARAKPAPKPAAAPPADVAGGLVVPRIAGFPVVVAVSARQDCVFQFQVDGEERVRWWTLKAGAQTTFKARKSLRLLVTNPAGIEAAGPGGPLPLTRGAKRPDHFLVSVAGVERLPLPPEATPAP